MTLQLRYVTHSEIGLIRKNNQDSGYASPHLLVVADGMGGAAAGDLASAVAIDTIRKLEAPTTGQEMLEVLAGAIHLANDKIAELVESDLSLEGMGTTVTGAMFDGASSAWRTSETAAPTCPRRSPGTAHARSHLGAIPRRRREDQ